VGYVFFLHRTASFASSDGLLPAAAGFRLADNILSIMLILSKNLGILNKMKIRDSERFELKQ